MTILTSIEIPPEIKFTPWYDVGNRGTWFQVGDNKEARRFVADYDFMKIPEERLRKEIQEWVYEVVEYQTREIDDGR